MEQGSYNLSLPRSLYGDDINGNTHADPMTQSCHIQLGASDTMSSSTHGGGMMMTNSMVMMPNGSMIGGRGVGGVRATAWNDCTKNAEGVTSLPLLTK